MNKSAMGPADLQSVGVLADLDKDELEQLADFGCAYEIVSGEKLIRENESQNCLYIVMKGKLRVYRLTEGFENALAELGVGEALGEMNFLDRKRASADVQATGGATVWRMTRDDFDRFEERHPRTAIKLLRALAVTVVQRLREAIQKIANEGHAVGEGWW